MKSEYRESKIGFIPVDWDLKTFQDISNIDKNSLKSSTDKNYKFEYISLSDVNSNDFKIETSLQVFENAPSRARRIVQQGDILMSTVRPNLQGFTFIKDKVENLIASTGFAVITTNAKALNEFVFHYLYSSVIKRQFHNLTVGSNYPAINSSDVKGLKIPVPPIKEQKAIADCLSTWDKAIEFQNEIISSKESRKKALTQQLLTGKKRLPGFNLEWKEGKLGDLFKERNETRREDLNLLSIGQQGVYPQSESNKRDISNLDKSKYKRIAPGDIGYNTMRMWQGRSALSNLEGIVSPAYTILIPTKNVNSYYFSILFRMGKMTNLFWRNSQGLVDDTLNCKYKDFAIISCEYPSIEEQNAIVKVLETADKELQLEKQKFTDLQQQKKALMQQLLTGKVRLVQPN